MSSSSSSSSADQVYSEELDTEFYCIIKAARNIIQCLKRLKDRDIANRLISRVEALNSDSLEVKVNRNVFTQYFLKVLQKTSETQPPEYDQWFQTKATQEPQETALWSPDRRTFVAAKTIPGFGMLVYLAVTNDPHLGWQENGFLTYKFD